eukprot:scaffold1793_cov245-Pinguiococcus_pyrenoidosus.AAC.1
MHVRRRQPSEAASAAEPTSRSHHGPAGLPASRSKKEQGSSLLLTATQVRPLSQLSRLPSDSVETPFSSSAHHARGL